MAATSGEVVLPLLGGALCLDFANTAAYRGRDNEQEGLVGYAAFVRWGQHAGAVGDAQARGLLAAADRDPASANAVIGRIRALREALARTFAAIAHAQSPATSDLDALSDAWATCLPHARLRRCGGEPRLQPLLTWALALPDVGYGPASVGFDWRWEEGAATLDRPLWPILHSAITLLTRDDLTRVRQCASADGCGWLFIDSTRNRSRQWCDSAVCGNRARARRHYARTKNERAAE